MFNMIIFVSAMSAAVALGAEPGEIDKPWFIGVLNMILNQFPEINIWLGSIMVFIMSALRALSELLFFISRKTESTSDDDIARMLAKALEYIGTVIGWFGLGAPKR